MAAMISPASAAGRILPSLLGALGVMLWATETVLITFTTAIPPLQTVALAFGFAALMSPLVWRITGDDPLAAFRQPPRVWLLTVLSLTGYHACIYYATQKAPPAAAALLQGTTPLMIVIGSALLPGERLRWWHVAGALVGLVGVMLLVEDGGAAEATGDPGFYLALIGVAAALWGLYSLASRSFGDVPSSALGVFYAASAALCLLLHLAAEDWVRPQAPEWLAIAALGVLPMGLAIYLWDHGVKKGDIQALGAFSYVEPFAGAVLVALLGQGTLTTSYLLAGGLVIGGAALASFGLWRSSARAVADAPTSTTGMPVADVGARRNDRRADLASVETALTRLTGELAETVRAFVENRSPGDRSERDIVDFVRLLAAAKQTSALWDAVSAIDAEMLRRDRHPGMDRQHPYCMPIIGRPADSGTSPLVAHAHRDRYSGNHPVWRSTRSLQAEDNAARLDGRVAPDLEAPALPCRHAGASSAQAAR